MAGNFQFVAGPDDFLVARAGEAHWAKITAGLEDEFAQEIVEGQVNTVAEVEEAVERFVLAVRTMPMFGDRKAVWLKGATFLADSVTGRAQGTTDEVEKLQAVLESLDPSQVGVLITAAPVDKRRKAFKWFQKHGEVELVEAKDNAPALAGMMQAEAKALGCTFQAGAAEALLARIQGNPRLALEEARKLATYIGPDGGSITEQLVIDLVPTFGEGDFFETVEAFYALDLPWTLDAIHRHFFLGYHSRPMITSLQNRNRLMIQMKALMDARALGPRISQSSLEQAQHRHGQAFKGESEKGSFNLFTQNPWYLSRLAAPLPKLSLKQLIEFQHHFLTAFKDVLDRPNEQEAVMRETALRCLG